MLNEKRSKCIDCGVLVKCTRCIWCWKAELKRRAEVPFPPCDICGERAARRDGKYCGTHRFGKGRISAKKWVDAATHEAVLLGVRPSAVMGGSRKRLDVLARMRAFNALLGQGFKLAPISQASGFHHTSVHYARKNRQKLEVWFANLSPTSEASFSSALRPIRSTDLPALSPARERMALYETRRIA